MSDRAVHDARIVLIDDNPVNLRVVSRSLARDGFTRVEGFSDARVAVASCLADEPDLVLLDLNMPEIDGFEVLDRLIAGLSDTRVLVFSGYVTDAIRQRARVAGAADVLEKSAFGPSLTRQIERLLLERGS